MATIPADARLPSRHKATSRLHAIVKATREAPLAAVVILGGLLTSTLLSLLVLPVLFERFGAPASVRLNNPAPAGPAAVPPAPPQTWLMTRLDFASSRFANASELASLFSAQPTAKAVAAAVASPASTNPLRQSPIVRSPSPLRLQPTVPYIERWAGAGQGELG